MSMESKQQTFSFWYFIIAMIALLAVEMADFDEEIGRLLEEAHARVKETLVMQRGKLEALAKLLLEKKIIDRPTLEQAIEIGEETVGATVTEGRPSNKEGGNYHAAL